MQYYFLQTQNSLFKQELLTSLLSCSKLNTLIKIGVVESFIQWKIYFRQIFWAKYKCSESNQNTYVPNGRSASYSCPPKNKLCSLWANSPASAPLLNIMVPAEPPMDNWTFLPLNWHVLIPCSISGHRKRVGYSGETGVPQWNAKFRLGKWSALNKKRNYHFIWH